MRSRDIHEKRKFARFPMRQPAICFRYGRLMTMRTLNISLGGLKLEAIEKLRKMSKKREINLDDVI